MAVKKFYLDFFYVEKDSQDFHSHSSFNDKFGYKQNDKINPIYNYTLNEILNVIGDVKKEVDGTRIPSTGPTVLHYSPDPSAFITGHNKKKFFSNGVMIFNNRDFGILNSNGSDKLSLFTESKGSEVVTYTLQQIIEAGTGDPSGILQTISSYAHFFYTYRSLVQNFSFDFTKTPEEQIQTIKETLSLPFLGKLKSAVENNLFKNDDVPPNGFRTLVDAILTGYKLLNTGNENILNNATYTESNPEFAAWIESKYLDITKYNNLITINPATKNIEKVDMSPLPKGINFANPQTNAFNDRYGSVTFELIFKNGDVGSGKIGVPTNQSGVFDDIVISVTMYIVPENYVNSTNIDPIEEHEVYVYIDDEPFDWGIDASLSQDNVNFAHYKINASEFNIKIVNKLREIEKRGRYNYMAPINLTKFFVKPTIHDSNGVEVLGRYTPDEVDAERNGLLSPDKVVEYEQVIKRQEPFFIFFKRKRTYSREKLYEIVKEYLKNNYFYFKAKYLNTDNNPATKKALENAVIIKRLPKVYPELFTTEYLDLFPLFSNGYKSTNIQSLQDKFAVFKDKSKYVNDAKSIMGKHSVSIQDISDYLTVTNGQNILSGSSNNSIIPKNVTVIHPTIHDKSPVQGDMLYTARFNFPIVVVNPQKDGVINIDSLVDNYLPLLGFSQNYQLENPIHKKLLIFSRVLSLCLEYLTAGERAKTEELVNKFNKTQSTELNTVLTYVQGTKTPKIKDKVSVSNDNYEYISFTFNNILVKIYGPMGVYLESV